MIVLRLLHTQCNKKLDHPVRKCELTDMQLTTISVPCETYARLAPIAMQPRHDANQWFRSLRYDNGALVVSNRAVMAVEQLDGPAAAVHITVDPALLAQCRTEAPAQSVLTITVNPVLGWATATTTMGYTFPGNAMVVASGENKLADWRTIVPGAASSRYKGPMFWDGVLVALLAASSPSGRIVFEEKPDIDKPMMVRDGYEDSWMGFFIASALDSDGISSDPAVVPGWLRKVVG